MTDRNDIAPERLNELYGPFEGPYTTSYDGYDNVYVEDNNLSTVCLFNTHTQLPLTDNNMAWEKNYWIDRATQICEALNYHFYNSKAK